MSIGLSREVSIPFSSCYNCPMGRLENFVLLPKKMRLDSSKSGEGQVSISGEVPLKVPGESITFLRTINGHSTLKEIFLFLNSRGIRPGIDRCLSVLNTLAKKDFFKNSDEFIRALNARGSQNSRQNFMPQGELRASFFSKARILGTLRRTTLFNGGDQGLAEQLYRFGTLKKVNLKERLIRKGSQSPYFYVLLSGELGVYRVGKLLTTLKQKAVFGENAAFTHQERNADVVATKSSWVFEVDASRLMKQESPGNEELIRKLKNRLLLNQTIAANPLFRSLPSDVLQLFVSKCRLEKHPKESVIIQQGLSNKQKFYFIVRGSVMVVRDGAPVTSLLPGEHFGEISSLLLTARTASIISETELLLLSLKSNDLYEILTNHFELGRQIEKTAYQRLAETGNIFSENLEGEDEESGTRLHGFESHPTNGPQREDDRDGDELTLASSDFSQDDQIHATATDLALPFFDYTDGGDPDEEDEGSEELSINFAKAQ